MATWETEGGGVVDLLPDLTMASTVSVEKVQLCNDNDPVADNNSFSFWTDILLAFGTGLLRRLRFDGGFITVSAKLGSIPAANKTFCCLFVGARKRREQNGRAIVRNTF